MASESKSRGIMKPLAAAFLTTEPEEDSTIEKKSAVKKPAPKPAPKPVEIKPAELTKEETRALLKEQLVSQNPLEEEKPVAAAKVSAKKEPEKKAAAKPAEKKAAAAPVKTEAKKPAVKKTEKKEEKIEEKTAGPEILEEVTIEFNNRSVDKQELVERALKIWTSKLKRGRSELWSMELYVKPQEQTVYYVFNKKRNGSFEL
ncbi:MAG: hypothetical protein IKI75_01215 [Lachnospiraceae bacterium]|nr:hypothetical protein [Lachnospiraceae bacterium]